MSELDAVLDRIDRDLDQSLERLFAFLKIQSVSTAPAYQKQCRSAAEFVAADLASTGFKSEVRPTGGHPVVIAKSGNGAGDGRQPRGLFYGHYDVPQIGRASWWG